MSRQRSPRCTSCGVISRRVHSRYARQLRDRRGVLAIADTPASSGARMLTEVLCKHGRCQTAAPTATEALAPLRLPSLRRVEIELIRREPSESFLKRYQRSPPLQKPRALSCVFLSLVCGR